MLIVLALATALTGAEAVLASPIDVIRDCSDDGKLDKHYSQKELKGALNNLPSDLDEYTDCRTVIRAAQLAGARKAPGKGNGLLDLVDRNSPPSGAEQRHLDRATHSPSSVTIGGERVAPGGGPLAAAFGTEIPGWLLAALIAFALGMLSGGGFAAQRRWPAAWRAALETVGGPARRLGEGVRRGIARFRR
jgi:hypothetical protein